ncbi:MAG: hypothetical protein V1850_04890 [Candidatus Bathyarchaeota archaeon]
MDNERFRIVQALSEFEGSVSINDLVARSELSRGKILGNLARLCIEGFVDKHGKQYAITNRGRALMGELNPVQQDKGFFFNLDENNYTGQIALSLKDLYDIVKTVDIKSIDFHNRRGDFENWIRNVLHDEEFANTVSAIRNENVAGEVLRDKLYEAVGRNYRMLNTLTT